MESSLENLLGNRSDHGLHLTPFRFYTSKRAGYGGHEYFARRALLSACQTQDIDLAPYHELRHDLPGQASSRAPPAKGRVLHSPCRSGTLLGPLVSSSRFAQNEFAVPFREERGRVQFRRAIPTAFSGRQRRTPNRAGERRRTASYDVLDFSRRCNSPIEGFKAHQCVICAQSPSGFRGGNEVGEIDKT